MYNLDIFTTVPPLSLVSGVLTMMLKYCGKFIAPVQLKELIKINARSFTGLQQTQLDNLLLFLRSNM